MKKMYDVMCLECEFTQEKFVNDFYEEQTCSKCGGKAKCIYSPLAFHFARVATGRTKEGAKWEYLGAGEIDRDSKTINTPKK